jgi:hypothetical protein
MMSSQLQYSSPQSPHTPSASSTRMSFTTPPPLIRTIPDNDIEMIVSRILNNTYHQDAEVERLADVALGFDDMVNSPIRQINFEDTGLKFQMNIDGLQLNHCASHSECSICLSIDVDEMNGGSLSCGHTFHTDCIASWFQTSKTSCPNCRTQIDVMSLMN